jgi:hypothetical protein
MRKACPWILRLPGHILVKSQPESVRGILFNGFTGTLRGSLQSLRRSTVFETLAFRGTPPHPLVCSTPAGRIGACGYESARPGE